MSSLPKFVVSALEDLDIVSWCLRTLHTRWSRFLTLEGNISQRWHTWEPISFLESHHLILHIKNTTCHLLIIMCSWSGDVEVTSWGRDLRSVFLDVPVPIHWVHACANASAEWTKVTHIRTYLAFGSPHLMFIAFAYQKYYCSILCIFLNICSWSGDVEVTSVVRDLRSVFLDVPVPIHWVHACANASAEWTKVTHMRTYLAFGSPFELGGWCRAPFL